MEYVLDNGKKVNIKDEELDNLCDKLDISLNEAVQVWLEDNGYEKNAEVEELTKKAKENRVTATVHGVVAKRGKREVTRKEDVNKRELIKFLADALEKAEIGGVVSNPEKKIDFEYNGAKYTLDLIKHREPKK
jgi:hypothetical protein